MIIDKSSHKWILDNLFLKSYLDVYEQYPIGIRFHLGIIGIWFYYQGKWNMVIIDTKIPSKYSHPIFSYTSFSLFLHFSHFPVFSLLHFSYLYSKDIPHLTHKRINTALQQPNSHLRPQLQKILW